MKKQIGWKGYAVVGKDNYLFAGFFLEKREARNWLKDWKGGQGLKIINVDVIIPPPPNGGIK
jgi:hypothetical protein